MRNPPGALSLLGHELRWRVAMELSRSDRTVGELIQSTGEAQNLVSYHLRQMREAGLVRERRSSADSRDVYYSLDRTAVATGLLEALAAISPAIEPESRVRSAPRLTKGGRASVLFLCTGNSARSQIAEAMLRRRCGGRVVVRSAGTRPAGVHPAVQKVLRQRGIPVRGLRSKAVEEFDGQAFDCVVSLCDLVREAEVPLAGNPRLIHWSIADPAAPGRGGAALVKAFERAADEIEVRVAALEAQLGNRRVAA